MSTKAYTLIDGQRIATGGYDEATSPAGWRAPDAAMTKPAPSPGELEAVYRLLCDLACAANESGNDELEDNLNHAADIVEGAIDALKPEAERGFGA